MSKLFPVVVKRTTQIVVGSGDVPTAVWDESAEFSDPSENVAVLDSEALFSTDAIQMLEADPEGVDVSDDQIATGTVTQASTAQASDKQVDTTVLPDVVDTSDATAHAVAPRDTIDTSDKKANTAAQSDSEQVSDSFQVVSLDYEPAGDTWLDQASAGTSHGAATSLSVKGKATIGNNETRGYLEFDFTKFAGMVAPAGTWTITLRGSATSSVSVTMELRTGAAQPFNESTATWTSASSNLAAYGTSRASQAQTVGTAVADVTYTFGQSVLQNAIDSGWLLCILTCASTVAPPTATLNSKENPGQHPVATFSLER